jgi:tetratricopeptide (TPR) repeat protein
MSGLLHNTTRPDSIRRCFALVLTLSLVGLAPSVWAQSSQESTATETAETDSTDEKKLTKQEKKRLLSLLKRARESFSSGNFQTSFDLLQEAYSLKRNPEYLYRMGLCQERMSQPEKALKYYRQYLDEKPDSNKRGSVEKTIAQLDQKVEARDEPAPDTSGSTSRTWAIATTSVAGVSTVAAIVFGILYSSADSTYHSMLDDRRSTTRSAVAKKAKQSNAYLAVTLGTAGLALASGSLSTFLWLQGGPERPPSNQQTSSETDLDLGVGIGLGGLQLKGRF